MENVPISDSNLPNLETEDEIPESEISELLETLHEESNKKMQKGDYRSSIVYLKKCEELLEAIMTQGGDIGYDTVLLTLHNLAFCYQKLGDLQKSITYIEACIYNVNTYKIFNPTISELHYKIKTSSYLSKTHIQSCAVFSQLNDHKKALMHARKSLSYSISIIKLTLKAASSYSSNILKLKKSRQKVPSPSLNIFSIITLVNPALKSLKNFISQGKPLNISKIPSVLGVKDYPDWVLNISLADIMLMKSLPSSELKDNVGIQCEFTKDFLIMKACILAVSYFCVSTEMQFLKIEAFEAENYHHKAVQLLAAFLPEQSTLTQHFKDSYKKRFRFLMEEIVINNQPEEDIPLNLTGHEEKLPSIRERPTSLTPGFKFKKISRRLSERPKTGTSFDSIAQNPYYNKTPKNIKGFKLKKSQ